MAFNGVNRDLILRKRKSVRNGKAGPRFEPETLLRPIFVIKYFDAPLHIF
jgi:hypothetical protein